MRTAIAAIAVTLGTAIVCAIGGGGIGWLIGYAAPSYYRTFFRHAADVPGFSPTEFGLGAGLAQGATMGFIIGALLVAVALFVTSRRRDRIDPPAPSR
jgi:hypothetical protein